MKYETHAEYDPRHSEMAQRAFLSIWSSFTRWHEDLVLLGGLVPRYICSPIPSHSILKPTTTIDVDLGIALGTDSGQYDPISTALAGFAEEVKVGNRACVDALKCLETLFNNENAPGPVRASHFLLGLSGESGHADEAFRRTQIRQQMVDVAKALRGVV